MTDGLLPFDDPPRRLLPAYPTRLTTWQDCPRRYKFAYLDSRPRGGSWAHFSVGSSVHEAMRRWFELPVEQRTPQSGAALVTKHWVDAGFRDDAQSKAMREKAQSWVTAYLEGVDPAFEPIGLERTIGTKTAVLSVRGKVDRIDLRRAQDGTEEVVIVDYKTGRRTPDSDDVRGSLQLAMYAAAASRTLRKPCTQVELHHLPSGTVAAWRHKPEAIERHLERAGDIALEVDAAITRFKELGGGEASAAQQESIDEVMPPRPGSACAWCDWQRSCPEGLAAAPAHRSWDALPNDVV